MRIKNVSFILVASLISLLIVVCAIWIITHWNRVPPQLASVTMENGKNHNHNNNKCDKHTCGAADPVSDPAYNMMEIVKQSILLEDHLADDRKYCRDCVCKHMMALEGYSEEALTLAGNKIDNYPHMKECPAFYQHMYQKWSKNKENEAVRKDVLTELREMRKKLMSAYLMNA